MRKDDSRMGPPAKADLGDMRSIPAASRSRAEFAKRLAAALGLPFHWSSKKQTIRPEQKTMANSTQQARNIDGSLALNGQPVPPGPVILVDDMVDSRWTLTVAAWLLRKSGSGEVWPMALSQTGHDE
jgi:ATP-dependent DNA helicase RecQ